LTNKQIFLFQQKNRAKEKEASSGKKEKVAEAFAKSPL
jgi:hypothetical protein